MSDDPVRFDAAGHSWTVDPGFEAFVRERLIPAVEHPEALEGARVVKENRLRTVARVDGPEGGLFCKRFRVLRASEGWIQRLIKGSPAWREHRALLALRAAGLDCPEPVVLGEARRGGRIAGSVLATREVGESVEMTAKLQELRRGGGEERQALIGALAAVAFRMFEAGGDHPDMHVGNFLVRAGGGLAVLDLHSLRLRRRVGAGRRRKRLAKLAWSFGPVDPETALAAREEIGWLADAYVAHDPAVGPAAPLAAWLLRRAIALEATRLRSRDRRCLKTTTSFVVETHDGKQIYRRREVDRDALLGLLDGPATGVLHRHPKGRSEVAVVPTPDGVSDAPLVVRKRYLYPSLRKRLAAVWCPLSLRAWKAARCCEVRGIPHAVHHGLVLERGIVLPRRGTVVMEMLADVTMIHVLLQREEPLAPAARRRLARDFGHMMGRFHASGLTSRDLAVQNVLIRPATPGDDGRAGWSLWLVDLDEVKPAALTRKAKLRALIHLGDLPPQATRTDRARFFRAYLEAGGRDVLAPELEAWGAIGLGRRVAEGLAARAEAKARRIARRVARPAPTDLSVLES